jgi:hypothetical protein
MAQRGRLKPAPPLWPGRFRVKWGPVRVKKTRQNKKLGPGSDSIRTGPSSKSLFAGNTR